ncbi:MAG: DUF2232 domain-containing protein [Hyphomicrobium sp.]|nr:DUF2232 domain-containing protein [Hyphomicrobium sp.]
MPINAIALAIAAGLISAVVFASATTGAVFVRLLLFFLTPLSLYLAGLGLGTVGVGIAAMTAVVTIVALASPLAGVVFAIATAVPAVVLSRLTLLSRTTDDGQQEWYPVGRLVATAAVFGGAFAAFALILLGGSGDDLAKAMRTLVETFVKSELPSIPGAPAVTEAQIDEIAATTLKMLPWALGILTTTTIVLNLWLAGRITLASGRLVRPWPKLSALALPSGATYAFLAAIALTFVDGVPALLGGGFAGAFTLAFALVGLAVAHVLTEGSPWRGFILGSLYASIGFFTAGAALLLALVGIAETIFKYRAADAGNPPENPH